MAVNLSHFYHHIVADVINNVRPDFLSEGVDEAVLQELQSLWELNMMQNGVLQAGTVDTQYRGMGQPIITPVHDLNMPYEGETPTAELLFPPTPAHTPLPSQMPTPQFIASIPSPCLHEQNEPDNVAIGRPAPYMHAPWMNQKVGMNHKMDKLDINVAYEVGDDEETANGQNSVTQEFLPTFTGKRKREDLTPSVQRESYFPQHDGSGDVEESSKNMDATDQMAAWTAAKREFQKRTSTYGQLKFPVTHVSPPIPQFDGIDDNYHDGVAEEDYNDPGEEGPLPAEEADSKPSSFQDAASEDSEPPLNEDDDIDDLDDVVEEDEKSKTDNLVLTQFEKVTRAKNKWKCILKDGIMHLQNREFLFSRANGEFDF